MEYRPAIQHQGGNTDRGSTGEPIIYSGKQLHLFAENSKHTAQRKTAFNVSPASSNFHGNHRKGNHVEEVEIFVNSPKLDLLPAHT